MLCAWLSVELLHNSYDTPDQGHCNDQKGHNFNEYVHEYLCVVDCITPVVSAILTYALNIVVAIFRLCLDTLEAHLLVGAQIGNATLILAVRIHSAVLIAKDKLRALFVH